MAQDNSIIVRIGDRVFEVGYTIARGSNYVVVPYGNYTIFGHERRDAYEVTIYRNNGNGWEKIQRIEVQGNGEVRPEDLAQISDVGDRLVIAGLINYVRSNHRQLIEEYRHRLVLSAVGTGMKSIPNLPTPYEEIIDYLARNVLGNFVVRTFMVNGAGTMGRSAELGVYCYDPDRGIYRECESDLESFIYTRVQGLELIRKRTVRRVVNEVLERVRALTRVELRESARHALVIGRQVFDWDKFVDRGVIEDALTAPKPDLVIFHWIPHDITRAIGRLMALRPGIEAYLPPKGIGEVAGLFRDLAPKSYEIFKSWVKGPDDTDETADMKVGLLLQLIGYVLYPNDYPFHKANLFVGSGSNGKSTYLNLIEYLVGPWNVSHVNLREMDPSVDRFALADMYGKLANISTEPYTGVFDPSRFKQITGEDTVRIERKFRDAFNARLYAKQFFAANKLPMVKEDTQGFWDRWNVILFPNRFPRVMGDEEFIRRFLAPEASEIILMSIYAFRIALLEGGFVSVGLEDPREVWLRRSDPTYAVIRDMESDGLIVFGRDYQVVRDDLYQLYTMYLNENSDAYEDNVRPVPKPMFTQKLEQLFSVKVVRPRLGSKRVYTYAGVAITRKGLEWLRKRNADVSVPEWVVDK